VLGKYLATVLVTVASLWIGLLLTTFIISRAERVTGVWEQLWPMAAAAAAGAMLLGAAFILVSLLIPRALLAGMLYVFAWESLLGRFLPGVRAISSRESMQKIYEALVDNDVSAAGQAFLPMVVVTVAALALTIWRLRTMQID
jgi:ABC-2 type transport system permease protein